VEPYSEFWQRNDWRWLPVELQETVHKFLVTELWDIKEKKEFGLHRLLFKRLNWNLDAFTTNYDTVVETACKTHKYHDGLVSKRTLYWARDFEEFERKFEPEFVECDFREDEFEKEGIRLYKLYGSVDWMFFHGGLLKIRTPRTLSHFRAAILSRIRADRIAFLVGPLIGWGVSKPPIYDVEWQHIGPIFRTLFKKMKEKLETAEKCLVVGYSFGDPRIAEAFRNVRKRRRGLPRVYLIDKFSCKSEYENKKREIENQIGKVDKLIAEKGRYISNGFSAESISDAIELMDKKH
jgi:hypothetical protein